MQAKVKVLFFLIFISLPALSATSSVRYGIPAVVELRAPGLGNCTGSIVGDNPLKVLTAEHCLGNYKDGGVEMLDPAVLSKAIRSVQDYKWVKSQRVFLARSKDYRKLLDQISSLKLEIKELELATSYALKKTGITDPAGLLFSKSQKNILSAQETNALFKFISESQLTMRDLQEKLKNLKKTLITRYTDHDVAVLIFPLSFPKDLSLDQKVKSRMILPIARQVPKEKDIPVVLGGFGITHQDENRVIIPNQITPPIGSHFTTNILSVNPKKTSLYSMFGNTSENLEKIKPEPATLGAPLKGDSGSAVLSRDGVIAVTSAISPYSSHQPPAPNWINSVTDPNDFVERYEYIMAHFPSTTAAPALDVFAQVEAEVGALVYSDNVAEYSKIFDAEKQSILLTAKRQAQLNLLILPVR